MEPMIFMADILGLSSNAKAPAQNIPSTNANNLLDLLGGTTSQTNAVSPKTGSSGSSSKKYFQKSF